MTGPGGLMVLDARAQQWLSLQHSRSWRGPVPAWEPSCGIVVNEIFMNLRIIWWEGWGQARVIKGC